MERKSTGNSKAVYSSRLPAAWLPAVVSAILTAPGCAGARSRPESAAIQPDPRVGELKAQLETLQSKLAGVELRLAAVNDKVDAARTSVETLRKGESLDPTLQEVKKPLVEGAELLPVVPKPSVNPVTGDPESGFVTDAAVQSYRKAMVLFDAAKYPEAILAFAQFLDQYADHPWAGSAQYHVGLCYVAQKEHKLAAAEFARVLTAYDRSPHVPDSILELAKCEDALNLKSEALSHRQQLLSLFPNSPAASRLRASKLPASAEPIEPTIPATAPAPQEKHRS